MATNYHITAVATITGLSVDTIRAWERRYGLVEPTRDAGGVRQYSDDQVTRLGLARAARGLGNPVRRIATLSNDDLRALVTRAANAGGDVSTAASAVDAALGAVQRYDVAEAQRLLRAAAVLCEPKRFVLDYLAPLLRAVGERWESGRISIAQEHLTSQLVRSVLGVLAGPVAAPAAESMLFATPPGESHEFGIQLAAVLAALGGRRTYVLGPNVPLDELTQSVRELRPAVVVLGAVVRGQANSLAAYVAELRAALPARAKIWIGGSGASEWVSDGALQHVEFVPTLEDFDRRLAIRP